MESVCVQYLRTLWFVSEISLARCAHSFDFRYVYLTNSCVNTVRMSSLYIVNKVRYRVELVKRVTVGWGLSETRQSSTLANEVSRGGKIFP